MARRKTKAAAVPRATRKPARRAGAKRPPRARKAPDPGREREADAPGRSPSFVGRLAECVDHARAGRYSDGQKVPSGTRAALVAFPGCGVLSVERSEANATQRAAEFMALFALRVLTGEPLEVVAGEAGVPEDEFAGWTERFLTRGLRGLLGEA